MKPLVLASKVKSLASKPHVLENCPVIGSRTVLFFEALKLAESFLENTRNLAENLRRPFLFSAIGNHLKKNFEDVFFALFYSFGDRIKKFFEDHFFREHLRLCPWPQAFLSLALRGSVLGMAVLGLRFFLCPWP